MTPFNHLHPALRYHIVNSFGWNELREVQSLSIKTALDGFNQVILAPTAGGKTEAAFFPIISQILYGDWPATSVIYVSPIKALLNNQEDRLQRLFSLLGRRAAVWHGDTSQSERKNILAEPPDCLLTTPESLEVLLVSTQIDHERFFRNIRCFVVDELHSFANDDRGWHLLSVFSRITKLAGRDIRRIGLSATVGNPNEMLDWLSAGSSRSRHLVCPKEHEIAPADVQLDYVASLENAAKVIGLLYRGEKRLVFCDSRSRVEELAFLLRESGVNVFVSHSSIGHDERRLAEQAFAEHQNCVIVATSSLELGLDIGDLDRVIQIDAPNSVSSFMQRMGRTGRRQGTTRNCLFLATGEEGMLRAAALVQLWRHGYIESVQPPSKPYHILAQQLMALVLQESGIGRSRWLRWIENVPAFAKMSREEIANLVATMLSKDILWEDSGILGFAKEGEAKFGRKNFLDLLSVFTTPPMFLVMYGNKELGSVHESSFYRNDRTAGILPVLILAGRSWQTNHIDWKHRLAYVEPSNIQGRSRWLGEGQMLHYDICQMIKRLLHSDTNDGAWSLRAISFFRDIRKRFSWLRESSTALVQDEKGHIRWWTFAGGIANMILSQNLPSLLGTESDNFGINFQETGTLEDAALHVRSVNINSIEPVVDLEAMHHLKFSDCLPKELATEIFTSRFRDPIAIKEVLSYDIDLINNSEIMYPFHG